MQPIGIAICDVVDEIDGSGQHAEDREGRRRPSHGRRIEHTEAPQQPRAGPGWPAGPFRLAPLAPLRLVLEVLVCEKLLLASRPDELRAAIDAVQYPVLELH